MHDSRGNNQFFRHRFQDRMSTFNAVCTRHFLRQFGTEICCYFWYVFREEKGSEIETAHAQKTRQPAGLFALVEISCILTVKDCLNFS